MRTILIGALFATLIGCCPTPPQARLEGCTSKGCFYRTAASPPIELKPAPFKPDPATTKVKPKKVANATTPSSAKSGNGGGLTKERTNSPVAMKPEVPPSGQPAEMSVPALKKPEPAPSNVEVAAPSQPSETPDPVLKKAKITVAAKMEDPTSAEFVDMKRATKKNTLGQPFEIICGHVKGKKKSGEAIGERPFLYLVKEDEAFIVDRNPDSVAAIAYRAHCISSDLHGQNLRQQP